MVSPALRFPLTNCRSASILLKKKSAGLQCEIFRNCLATKKKTLTTKLLKVISGGQTGVDRGALDAALALQVECGGWCPEGRLAEDGTIPKRYPVMELANAGYAERTARNVADSDGTLIISNGVPLGGTGETVDRCIEMRKPHLIIDSARRSVQETIEVATRVRYKSVIPSRADNASPARTEEPLERPQIAWRIGRSLAFARHDDRVERGRSTGQPMARRSQNCATNCVGHSAPLSGQNGAIEYSS